jgi:hypothetical protein
MEGLPVRLITLFCVLFSCLLMGFSAHGAELVFSDDFESGNVDNWTGANYQIYSTDCYEGSYCSRQNFPSGLVGMIRTLSTEDAPDDELFIRYRIKIDSGWNVPTYGVKWLRLKHGNTDGIQSEFFVNNGSFGAQGSFYQTGTYFNNPSFGWDWDANDEMTDGEWHLVEVFVKYNTPGNSDGVLRIWGDGDLKYQNTSTVWRSGTYASDIFRMIYIPSNGSSGASPSANAYTYIDAVEIWNGMPDATCENYPSECTIDDCEPNNWYWDTVNEECLAEEPGSPVNGACGANDGVTLSSLTSGNINNCANGTTVDNFSGTGPWTWDCVGLNGGTTEYDCEASLASPVAGALRQGAFRIGGLPARFVEAQP